MTCFLFFSLRGARAIALFFVDIFLFEDRGRSDSLAYSPRASPCVFSMEKPVYRMFVCDRHQTAHACILSATHVFLVGERYFSYRRGRVDTSDLSGESAGTREKSQKSPTPFCLKREPRMSPLASRASFAVFRERDQYF